MIFQELLDSLLPTNNSRSISAQKLRTVLAGLNQTLTVGSIAVSTASYTLTGATNNYQLLIMTAAGAKTLTVASTFPTNTVLVVINASESGDIVFQLPGGVKGGYSATQNFTVKANNSGTSIEVLQTIFKAKMTIMKTVDNYWVLL